jgi:hypothetical protein
MSIADEPSNQPAIAAPLARYDASAPQAPATLAIYDRACKAIAEALSVDELKQIRVEAEALRAAAKVAKNRGVEADAIAIRMRAVRRLDQLIEAQKATVGLAKGGKPYQHKPTGVSDTPVATLAMQGIDKNLAKQARTLGALSDESFEAVVADARDKVNRAVRNAVREVEIEQERASYSLETPRPMLPLPDAKRRIHVARNRAQRRWMLAIGPDISSGRLIEKEQAARDTAGVRQLQIRQMVLQNKALELEDQLKDLHAQINDVGRGIEHEIKAAVGPVSPFTETFDFQADEQVDAELAALPQHDLVDRLLSARGAVGDGFHELERGWWGDMRFMSYQAIIPGPGGGFDGIGSPAWLAEIFPDVLEPDPQGEEGAR